VIAASVTLGAAPDLRIDSVVNAASLLGAPLFPGGAAVVQGAGFGTGTQLLIAGSPVALTSVTPTSLGFIVPAALQSSVGNAVTVQAQAGGGLSNPVSMPLAQAAPGIFSVDGTGYGQGWILNQDGTPNSPSDPAAEGSIITIFATGVGLNIQSVAVYIDGFYANGVDSRIGAVPGLPGDVYQVRVYVPIPADLVAQNPNLQGFVYPPQVPISLVIDGIPSQGGIALSVQ
jgi:uncharacterized protein (TIGR03437 family)